VKPDFSGSMTLAVGEDPAGVWQPPLHRPQQLIDEAMSALPNAEAWAAPVSETIRRRWLASLAVLRYGNVSEAEHRAWMLALTSALADYPAACFQADTLYIAGKKPGSWRPGLPELAVTLDPVAEQARRLPGRLRKIVDAGVRVLPPPGKARMEPRAELPTPTLVQQCDQIDAEGTLGDLRAKVLRMARDASDTPAAVSARINETLKRFGQEAAA
jgi:hypothetical protein